MIVPLILVLIGPYAGQWIISHMDMDGSLQIPSNQGFIEDFGAQKDATEEGGNRHQKRSFGKIRILKRNGMGNIRLLRKREGKDGRIRLLKKQNGINKLIWKLRKTLFN